MNLKELLTKNRTYRRFHNEIKISDEQLLEMIEMTRLTASAANLQPLKYKISSEATMNEQIFSTLKWAGYLPNWDGPIESERPTGYIIIFNDNDISKKSEIDVGIVSQTILLKAIEMGFGGCMFGAIDRIKLNQILLIKNTEKYSVKLVIALGKPKEIVELVDIKKDESIKYYRDKKNIHYVPKRELENIMI